MSKQFKFNKLQTLFYEEFNISIASIIEHAARILASSILALKHHNGQAVY